MTFGEKIKQARIALNLSQSELADITGISERSIYTYEQTGTLPRTGNISKLAEALNVTREYLLDEDETDTQKNYGQEIFIANIRNEFGNKGAREASEVLSRAAALFAGGDLEDSAKDVFFQSLMEVYLESKTEAREKFSTGRRKRRNSNLH